MSRLPVSTTFDPLSDNVNCNFFDTVTNIDKNCVKRLTQRNHVPSRVYHYIVSGWPESIDPLLTPYRTRRDELSTEAMVALSGVNVLLFPQHYEEMSYKSFMSAIPVSQVWRLFPGHTCGGQHGRIH